MADHGLSFPIAVDDDQGTIARALGVPGFPMLYFVASDGTVRFAASGEVDEATLVGDLEALLIWESRARPPRRRGTGRQGR